MTTLKLSGKMHEIALEKENNVFLKKVNKGLEKYDLSFENQKECNEKYKGYLCDLRSNTKLKFEVWKSLRLDLLNQWAKAQRDYMDIYIKLTSESEGK